MLAATDAGIFYSRNLTPDQETGIGQRADEELKRVLRSGVFYTGRLINHRAMPWSSFTNWTEEDLYAVVQYLRQIKAVKHQIPEPTSEVLVSTPSNVEIFVAGDFAQHSLTSKNNVARGCATGLIEQPYKFDSRISNENPTDTQTSPTNALLTSVIPKCSPSVIPKRFYSESNPPRA